MTNSVLMRASKQAAAASLCALLLACGDNLAPRLDDTDATATLDALASCEQCPKFVGSWGGLGTDAGEFIEPSSVELRSDGVVIVAGHEDRYQTFTADGVLIDIVGTPGPGNGQFNHPHGLAVDRDRDDLMFVGDQENHRLQVFDGGDEFVRQFGDERFQHIHDVGIDRASGDIFVGDLELDTIRRFTSFGAELATFGGPGNGPGRFSAVWGMSTDSAGFLYAADTNNRRVQKLSGDGVFVKEWSDFDQARFEKPTGVYVDENDVVYICDSLAELVVLFDTDGRHLETWNLRAIVGTRTEPEDIVIDNQTGDIYIAEVFAHSVIHLRRD